jgi:NADH-quinone oxidoreductase subunit N
MPLLPELLLTGAALLLLLLDSDRPGRKAWLLLLTFAALVGAAVCVSTTACGGATTCCPTGAGMVKTPMFQGMVDITPVTTVLRALLLIGVALIVALSAGFEGFQRPRFAWGTYLGLLLLSTVGLFLLVAATDLMMILIAIELVSVTSFVLTAIVKDDRRSSEAALKYFLVGAFSAGLMIYGFSLLYGITGTTNVAKLMTSETTWPLLPMMGAWMFVLAGFGFKLALAPFHMWAPDVYEGAPTPVTAFLSVAPKTAAFGMLLRFFSQSDS